jgi:hypothetical protein
MQPVKSTIRHLQLHHGSMGEHLLNWTVIHDRHHNGKRSLQVR